MPVKAGVVRAGARTTKQGSPDTFTGTVFQDPVITANSPSRLGGSVVTAVRSSQRLDGRLMDWAVAQGLAVVVDAPTQQ